MIDVFIRTTARRKDLYERTLGWWLRHPEVHVVTFHMPGMYAAHDDRDSREWAESYARSPFYILTDDDVLPHSDEFITDLMLPLRSRPLVGMTAAWLDNEQLRKQTAAGDLGDFDGFVTMIDVGGCRAIRRGIVTAFPPPSGIEGYDATHCRGFRELGFYVGYTQRAVATHIGKGRSHF